MSECSVRLPQAVQAQSAVRVLDLLEASDGGSSLLHWWTRSQPIRTVAQLPLEFALIETRRPFAYQAIAKEALTLHSLGMSAAAIARALGVTDKTVSKAIRRARRDASTSPSP